MKCSECLINYELNSCEKFFLNNTCSSCRNENRHRNSLTKEENSLWLLAPNIAKSWAGKLNSLLPIDVGAKSQKPYYFNCENCSTTIFASPGNLTRGILVNCSPCANIARGVANSRPKKKTVSDSEVLLKIWDFKKNSISPTKVALRSNKKFYWLCEFDHSTLATVDNRFSGKRCGVCTEKLFVSKPETALRLFIKTIYEGPVEFNKRNYIYPYELDLVLPELKIAIEFNGVYFHGEDVIKAKHSMTGLDYHSMKIDRASKIGFNLLFVWEDDWYNRNIIIKEVLAKAIDGVEISPLLKRLEVSAVDEKNC